MLRTCLVLRGVIVLATSASGFHLGGPLRSSKPNGWFRTARPLFSTTASSILGELTLDYAGLMRRICEGLQPAVLQAKYDKFHPNVLIINTPNLTMQHPYLSMNITEKADLVLADKEAPSCRTKPLFAVVTGMGRGKTRFCVELDWELKKRSNVVSIPITFSCFWSDFDTTFKDELIDYAVNIVSRMLSIHYGTPLHFFRDRITSICLRPIKRKIEKMPAAFSESFIRAAVRHIVEQMSAAGRQVEHFVLIVDESKRVEEIFGQYAHDILRSALLNTPIDYLDLQPQARPNVHLVMTSLDLSAIGVTSSGRSIRAISLPASLDATEVFDRWVQRYAPEVSKLSEGAKRRIRFLIAVFATTPRAVEVLCGYLSERYYGPGRTTNGAAELDSASCAQLFRDVQEALSERYEDVNFVMTAKPFHGLLFNKNVQVDDRFLEGITNSVLTNSFATISPNVNVVPQTSIGAAYRQAVLVHEDRHYLYMPPVAGAVDSLLAHLNTPANGSEYVGNTLEIISRALISCRLAVNGESQRRVSSSS
eukprot:gene28114-33947_t